MTSKEYAHDVLDAVLTTYATDDFEVALLSDAPSASSGTISLSGVELTEDDYARVAVLTTAFDAPTGNNPAYIANTDDILFDYNEGVADWDDITHVAVLSNDVVLQVIQTSSPVTIAPGRRVRIAAGALKLRVDTV